jgi:hypothetical protein
MSTQAQEIDGHVLINDLGSLEDAGTQLSPGDLVEVTVTEALPHDLLGRVERVISPARLRTAAVESVQIHGSSRSTH